MLTLQVLIYTLIISVCLAEPLIRDIVVNRLSAYDIPSIPLFKGIIKGNLSPYCYTRFLNQDSFYLDSSTARWDAARKMASADPEFQQFCNMKYQSMVAQTKQYSKKIAINEFGGRANGAILSYTTDQTKTFSENNVYYILMVNYACSASWPMLAKQIEPLARKDGNPYYIWIEENQSFDHVIQYEQQIAKYQVQFKEGWTRIVERMVDHEIAFFREVCPQEQVQIE